MFAAYASYRVLLQRMSSTSPGPNARGPGGRRGCFEPWSSDESKGTALIWRQIISVSRKYPEILLPDPVVGFTVEETGYNKSIKQHLKIQGAY